MFGLTRWNSSDDVFNFQREVDRLFNQFWSDLPTRTAAGSSPSFLVNTTDDGWRIDIPLPGIDPKDVAVEAAGNNLTIRAESPSEDTDHQKISRYEQTFAVPQFLVSNFHGPWLVDVIAAITKVYMALIAPRG